MKRKISFVLCILIVMFFVFIYFTNGNITFDNIKEFSRLKSKLPEGSEIKFSDGEFHIYVEHLSDVCTALRMDPFDNIQSTAVYAPDGGSFRMGSSYVSDESYSQVFMPRAISRLVIFKLQNSEIIDHIYDEYASGNSIPDIIKSVKSTFGIDFTGSLTDGTLKFVVETLYDSDINYDEDMIIDAYFASYEGNVSVLSISQDAWSYNIYYPWGGNYCTSFVADAIWIDWVYVIAK